LQTITLKENKEDFAALTRSVAVYIADPGQLRDVAQTTPMPQSFIRCALSLGLDPKGGRHTSDKIGKYCTESARRLGFLLC
jgi:hypothetical protein